MFTSELATFINLFDNLQKEYQKTNSILTHRIKELSLPQDFYEDAALQSERDDLITQLQNNEREITQINTIISILIKTQELMQEPTFDDLKNDADYRLLREKLASEAFNPSLSRQVDIDQKAAAIFDASNALENLQNKVLSQGITVKETV